MAVLLALLLIAILFGLGFVVKALFWVALAMLAIWMIGWLAHGPHHRWYYW
jgi:hypothetical protein